MSKFGMGALFSELASGIDKYREDKATKTYNDFLMKNAMEELLLKREGLEQDKAMDEKTMALKDVQILLGMEKLANKGKTKGMTSPYESVSKDVFGSYTTSLMRDAKGNIKLSPAGTLRKAELNKVITAYRGGKISEGELSDYLSEDMLKYIIETSANGIAPPNLPEGFKTLTKNYITNTEGQERARTMGGADKLSRDTMRTPQSDVLRGGAIEKQGGPATGNKREVFKKAKTTFKSKQDLYEWADMNGIPHDTAIGWYDE